MSNAYLTRPIHLEDKNKLPKWKALCGSGSRILASNEKDVTCKCCIKLMAKEQREGGA
jgi:hypothetical protein